MAKTQPTTASKPAKKTSPQQSTDSGGETGVKKINLALQGGGAHGAFTWGVLDYLLEDGRIQIDGISGTSAGAMNAVVMADGMAHGGADAARERLESFWRAVSDTNRYSPIQTMPWDKAAGRWSLDSSPFFLFFDLVSRVMSPYQLNPINYNPLREIIDRHVDFSRMHEYCPIKLFICATNVRTGKAKIFTGRDVNPDALLASASLPFLFQAVPVDGEYYWDGGFMGNPLLCPLIDACQSLDILLVQINPVNRQEIPMTAREIIDRVDEISFNSSLLHEMRSIDFVTRMVEKHALPERYKPIYFHCIQADEQLKALGATSKMNADWDFLQHLKFIGRESAREWVDASFDSIGVRSTLDIPKTYL